MNKLVYIPFWLFVFSIPCESFLVIPNIGSISYIPGIMAVGMSLILLCFKGRLRIPSYHIYIMLIFVIWVGLGYFWTMSPSKTLSKFTTYAQLLMTVWIAWQYAYKDKEQRGLLFAFVLGAYVPSIATIMNFLHGTTQENYGLRYVPAGYEPNELGLVLAMAIPMAWYLIHINRSRAFSWLCYLYVPLGMTAILLTASRGGFIAAIVACLYILLTFNRLSAWGKILIIAAGLIAVIAVAEFVPVSSWDRLSTIGTELDGGDMGKRTYIWKAGLEVFANHPLLGIGSGAFPVSVESLLGVDIVAHNVFISVLTELGLVGFSIFILLIITLVWSAARYLSVFEKKFWIILFLTWLIGVMTLTWEFRKPTWFMFGMMTIQVAKSKKQQEEAQEDQLYGTRHSNAKHSSIEYSLVVPNNESGFVRY